MYKIEKIRAKNTFSFIDLDYELKQDVTTSIIGENRDNDSQQNNGSGKSSLIETIAIALTGTSLRKVKNVEIINDSANESFTSVTLFNKALEERLVISRTFFRKSSPLITIDIYKNGKKVEDPLVTKLSGVEEYNKYILDKIGLSKDELFNNFILSRSRYTNFLEASDTSKKETINRFSRGNLIDVSIEQLELDTEPIKKEVLVLESEVAKKTGFYEAISEQYKDHKNNKQKTKEEGEAKIKDLELEIKELKEVKTPITKSQNEKSRKSEALNKTSKELLNVFESLNDKNTPEDDVNELINFIENHSNIVSQIDYKKELDKYLDKYDEHIKDSDDLDEEIKKHNKDLKSLKKDLKKLKDKKALAINAKEILELNKEQTKLDKKLLKVDLDLTDLDAKKTKLSTTVKKITILLGGKIKCPKCKHEFVPGEDIDVETKRNEKSKILEEISSINLSETKKNKQRESINNDLESNKDKISTLRNEDKTLNNDITSISNNIDKIQNKITSTNNKIDIISNKLDAIDEEIDVFIEDSYNDLIDDLINRANKLDNEIEDGKKTLIYNENQISLIEEKIKVIKNDDGYNVTLKDLQKRKKDALKALKDCETKLEKKELELNSFIKQKELFVEFKSYLANSKIKELESITNDFLNDIGSDLRILFSGFKKNSNGKIRNKIDVSLLRDGIEAGSFSKLSGGEKARITLANILALAQLINTNCDDDKGLDILVLDEILEAVDGSGLMAILDALNKTKVTCLLVSHGKIAENYPYQQVVIKENEESKIL